MSKKTFIVIIILVLCVTLTGCAKPKEIKKSFTMICTSQKNDKSMKAKTVTTYQFNKRQLVTSSETVTTQIFKDKKTYKTYRDEEAETVLNTLSDTEEYTLTTDEVKLKLIFTKRVSNINKSVTKKDDKTSIKAKTILEAEKKQGSACKLKGVTKSQLK